jgi:hypothetical protein
MTPDQNQALTLRLLPRCTAVLQLAAPLDLDPAPTGRRVVAEITAAEFSGERFTASMAGAACADWYTSAAGGVLGLPDVRITVRTTDEALVLIRYTGRVSTPTGRAAGPPPMWRRSSKPATTGITGSTTCEPSARATSHRMPGRAGYVFFELR